MTIFFRLIAVCAVLLYTQSLWAQELERHARPDEVAPYGTIRYEGVVNACIYLIDGRYVESSPETKTRVSSIPAPVKIVMYVALFPIFFIKGVFSMASSRESGYRVSPGKHRVRIGYWTNKTKWVARDFDIDVKAGQSAVIKTVVTDGSQAHPEKEVARIEHQNVTVYFDILYEPTN